VLGQLGGNTNLLSILACGEAYLRAGCAEEAHRLAQQGLASSREHKMRGQEAQTLWLHGEIAMHGRPPDVVQAEVHYQQALTLAEALGMRPLQAHGHHGLGTLYVANSAGNSVTVYAPGATGDVAPTRSISGVATGLLGPTGLALDGANNLYVTNPIGVNHSVTVYAAGASGDVAPIRTISGGSTGLNSPRGVVLDGSGALFVANGNNSVTVYAAGATGNAAPIRTISGASTGLNNPVGIALRP